MINFKTVTLCDKDWIDKIVMEENSPSADYNFSNIYIWDKHYRQLVCNYKGRMLTKLRYEGKPAFVFPIGSGELRPAVEALRRFAADRDRRIASSLCALGVPRLSVSASQHAVICAASMGSSAMMGDAPTARSRLAQSFAVTKLAMQCTRGFFFRMLSSISSSIAASWSFPSGIIVHR